MTEKPEAGWYAEPEKPGQLRRWDGEEWTDETRPNPNHVPDGEEPKTRLFKKPWFWVAMAVAVAVMGLFVWVFFSIAKEAFSGQKFLDCLEAEGVTFSHRPDYGETVEAEINGSSFYVTYMSAEMGHEELEETLGRRISGVLQSGNVVATPEGALFRRHEYEVITSCQ